MKILFGILSCLFLLSCDRISAPQEEQIKGQIQIRDGEYPIGDSSFYIQNDVHVNIGWVGIRLVDSTLTWVNVPDSGTYSIHLSNAPAFCLIKNQILLYSNPEWIRIDQSTLVHAGWATNVIVIDQDEVN